MFWEFFLNERSDIFNAPLHRAKERSLVLRKRHQAGLVKNEKHFSN